MSLPQAFTCQTTQFNAHYQSLITDLSDAVANNEKSYIYTLTSNEYLTTTQLMDYLRKNGFTSIYAPSNNTITIEWWAP